MATADKQQLLTRAEHKTFKLLRNEKNRPNVWRTIPAKIHGLNFVHTKNEVKIYALMH